MRQRMWRRVVAAAVAVVVSAGAAAAQAPAPQPAPAAGVVQAGCSSCGTYSGHDPKHGTRPGGYHNPVPAPYYANNGCSTLQQDTGFLFGSCKSFFSPCGPGGLGGGCGTAGLFGSREKCPTTPILGHGGTGKDGCKYDSYANH